MYINVENDNILKDLLNLEMMNDQNYMKPDYHQNVEVLSPQEGLTIANMFYNLYKPYKHYQPKKLVANNEQEMLMLKIQELSFAVNDFNLYLDLHPNDQKIFNLYKQCNLELKQLEALYADKYTALCIEDDLKEKYSWNKNPWPWEGNNV